MQLIKGNVGFVLNKFNAYMRYANRTNYKVLTESATINSLIPL